MSQFDPTDIPDVSGMPPELGKAYLLIHQLQARIFMLESQLPQNVREAVEDAMKGRVLSEDEQRWVSLAVKAQAQRVEFRRAVIEKTIPVLLVACIAFVAKAVWEYVKSHATRS